MNNLKGFISGTSDIVFSIFFCSNIAALKTSFWACPLETDHIKLNACDVYSLEAHLEVYFSGCLPEETFIDAHQKLHFRNIGRHLLNLLLLEHRHLEDVFLGTPSEDRQNKTEYMWRILSRTSFGSFFRLLSSWRNAYRRSLQLENNTKVLKVRQISVYALTVRLSLWISDLVHEVSVRQ